MRYIAWRMALNSALHSFQWKILLRMYVVRHNGKTTLLRAGVMLFNALLPH